LTICDAHISIPGPWHAVAFGDWLGRDGGDFDAQWVEKQPMFRRFYRQYGKRTLDLLIVAAQLVLLAPVLAMIALLARWRLGPAESFVQQRPGRFGRPFASSKSRTIRCVRNRRGELWADHVPQTEGVIVVGGGGHAKVVVSTLKAVGTRVEAVFDDRPALWGQKVLGVPVRGPVAELEAAPGLRAVIAVGDNHTRRQLVGRLDLQWVRVVHPHAYVHDSVVLGEGTVVLAGAVIQPDSTIGAHCIVNTAATIDHDCTIGDFVHLAPGVRLAGGVRVSDGVLMGIASTALPNVAIGQSATVGASATVIHDVPPGVVAVGTPARTVKPKPRYQAAS